MQIHFDLLARFPDTKTAAATFGVANGRIRHWRIRGIPAQYWPRAEEISKKEGWGITAAQLAAAARAFYSRDERAAPANEPDQPVHDSEPVSQE